jgi:2-polyprenyl-3-methyl-5-hydroxy-6-metoxy-1,4-benzoquinol methylase
MSIFLKKECQCCGNKTIKKTLTFDTADVYICSNSCVSLTPKIQTNFWYTPSYFKNNYEKKGETQVQSSLKLTYFLKKHLKAGAILDYGCGIGRFLVSAEKEGFIDNVGIDVSEYAVSQAQLRAVNSNFYTTKYSLGLVKFDCISFIDSIAHIEDTNVTFSKLIGNNLNHNGVVLIRTPNINSAYLFYAALIGYISPKKHHGSFLFIPRRLFSFNTTSIKLFLNKHGLEIQDIFIEPDFNRNASIFSNGKSIKSIIDYIFRIKIPSFINPNNSMTLIAKIKLNI